VQYLWATGDHEINRLPQTDASPDIERTEV
jgi:hypothetical protein